MPGCFWVMLATGLMFFDIGQALAEEGQVERKAQVMPAADSYDLSSGYVNNWILFMDVKGLDPMGDVKHFPSRPGVNQVVVFLSTWCDVCQKPVQKIQEIEKKLWDRPVEFIYIFSYDLSEDVKRYARDRGLDRVLLADHDLLKAFHNPPLPSVYLSDRDQHLLQRLNSFTTEDVDVLSKRLMQWSSY